MPAHIRDHCMETLLTYLREKERAHHMNEHIDWPDYLQAKKLLFFVTYGR